jgi:hypothetical protein
MIAVTVTAWWRDGIVRFGLPHACEPGLQMVRDDLVDDSLLRASEPVDRGGGTNGPSAGAIGYGTSVSYPVK